MADRKRAPKINALNVERTNAVVQIILRAFDLLTTLMPPTPKLHASMEMFQAYARDFACFRETNYLAAETLPTGSEDLAPAEPHAFTDEQ